MTDNNQIIRAAHLLMELGKLEKTADAGEFQIGIQKYERVLDVFNDPNELQLVWFLGRLMANSSICFQTDNRESLNRLIELTRTIGAEVVSFEEDDELMKAVFALARKQ